VVVHNPCADKKKGETSALLYITAFRQELMMKRWITVGWTRAFERELSAAATARLRARIKQFNSQ